MKPFIIAATILGALVAPAATFYALVDVAAPETVSNLTMLLMATIGIAAVVSVGRLRVFWGVLAALLYFPVASVMVIAAGILAGGYDLP